MQKCKKSRGKILKFSTWTTKLTLNPNRSQTRSETSEQTDARVEIEVTDEDKIKTRWRTITMRTAQEFVRLKNINSSDNGGTDTAEGPNGVIATVDRHAPPLHLGTPLNLPLHDTGDTHGHCTFHLHFGSSSVIRFNEVPSMLTSLLSRNKIREHVDCLAPIVLTVAKAITIHRRVSEAETFTDVRRQIVKAP